MEHSREIFFNLGAEVQDEVLFKKNTHGGDTKTDHNSLS